VAQLADIDRLIEEGLARYGKGDLDGALEVWEQALAIDGENAQATSYVDYVRQNYELLVSGPDLDASDASLGPFGVVDAVGEYEVEVYPGEVSPATARPALTDPMDEGWFLEPESSGVIRSRTTSGREMIEMEVSEPGDGVSFDDATREYHAGRPATRDMELARDAEKHDRAPDVRVERPRAASEFPLREATPPFGGVQDTATPNGFAAQRTDVKRRDLGFVQATGLAADRPPAARRPSAQPPELKMTLRTPELPISPEGIDTTEITLDRGGPPALDLDFDPMSTPPPPGAPAPSRTRSKKIEDSIAAISLDLDASDDMLGPAGAPPPPRARTLSMPTDSDLPLPAPIEDDTPDPDRDDDDDDDEPEIEVLSPSGDDPDPGAPLRDDDDDEADQFGPDIATADLPSSQLLSLVPPSQVPTRDLPAPNRPPARKSEPPASQPYGDIVGLPTRDLGIRPSPVVPASKAPTRRLTTNSGDDEPTGQADVRTLRPPAKSVSDPAEARSSEILDEVDRDIPAAGEGKDERTRRRIQGLLERASVWARSGLDGDLDRAVTAVDLALDEDASSALAQKLVHRNRDAIMGVFQSYLGDLQRSPMLAKPLHELANTKISPRAAFLCSRIDGVLSLDEILDVSGMPRLEAYRYLCQLYLRGILR